MRIETITEQTVTHGSGVKSKGEQQQKAQKKKNKRLKRRMLSEED